MCYLLRKWIEKVTPLSFSGEVSASTAPLGPHASHGLTLLGLRPSQREHVPATPVLCPPVQSPFRGHPPCLSPWPRPHQPISSRVFPPPPSRPAPCCPSNPKRLRFPVSNLLHCLGQHFAGEPTVVSCRPKQSKPQLPCSFQDLSPLP